MHASTHALQSVITSYSIHYTKLYEGISDIDLATKFLGNVKVSTHAAGTGRISATGDLDLTRLEQILERYEAKMMREVKSGVDDNLMFRQPAYILKSGLGPVTSYNFV